MNKFLLLVCSSLLILFASNSARGCTCELPFLDKSTNQQVIEALRKAKAVFVGKALTVESPADIHYRTVTFEIQSAWKGTHAEKLTITTGQGGGDCGYNFEVGETYLVYAYQSNKSYLGTNICQRTSPYHKELADLKYLGEPEFRACAVGKNEAPSPRLAILDFSYFGLDACIVSPIPALRTQESFMTQTTTLALWN